MGGWVSEWVRGWVGERMGAVGTDLLDVRLHAVRLDLLAVSVH